ncbi:serine protein kinase RIO [Desulfurococcus amylolyticus]|uniref:non-specific serine/threonine protein kinase n=3 Tax=Desulfurococcus TaxID=2273 RepID=B8D5N2_DESA1|nr:serine protein kinase RIO [Desulfurococcus amylolyticus]ACL11413.1 putative kinase [Desulfurococcus amylolyticus 1221n]
MSDDIDKLLRKKEEPRRKDKDLFETVEEVFDTATVMTIIELIRKKIIKKLNGVVNTGKEARVYLGIGYNGEYLAVKIYLTSTAEFKKGIYKYIMGDPRFRDVKIKDTRTLVYVWTRKEYRNLKRLYEAGVKVPRPVAFLNNVLVMEFLGENGNRYPLLIEAYKELEVEELKHVYHLILDEVVKIYCKAGLVHGDLSVYNIVVTPGLDIAIIDVGQAVDLSHPNSEEFLIRDIENINRFFREETGISTYSLEEILEAVKECRTMKKED